MSAECPRASGSGDYAIAFSTAASVRRIAERRASASSVQELPNDKMSPLFQAVAEATEEAVLNSLFKAQTMEGDGARIDSLPLDPVLREYRRRSDPQNGK